MSMDKCTEIIGLNGDVNNWIKGNIMGGKSGQTRDTCVLAGFSESKILKR